MRGGVKDGMRGWKALAALLATVGIVMFLLWGRPESSGSLTAASGVVMVSTIKPFDLMEPVDIVRMENSLKSYALQKFGILLLADDAKGCEWVRKTGVKGVKCVGHTCIHDKYKRPTLSCILDEAVRIVPSGVLSWINLDIMVGDSYSRAVQTALSTYPDDVLVVGRRTDVPVSEPVDFSPGWEDTVMGTGNISMSKDWAIDYFVFRTKSWPRFRMLPFLVGVWRWDNYWLARAVMDEAVTVVDATRAVKVYHQYEKKSVDEVPNHTSRTGHEYNDELVLRAMGFLYLTGGCA